MMKLDPVVAEQIAVDAPLPYAPTAAGLAADGTPQDTTADRKARR